MPESTEVSPAPAAGPPTQSPDGPVHPSSTGERGRRDDVDPARRLTALDGLRGIAILLVVLSHGWHLFSVDWIDQHGWARAVFRSGNSAVTVFLLISGFLSYRALTRGGDATRTRLDVPLARRVVRVAPTLWLMLAVLMLVAALDPTDTLPWRFDRASVLHVVTYTYNWYVHDNLLAARPDLGHLWYLSVDMQAFVVMAGVLYLMRRRPVGILFLLGGFYLLLTWWRFQVMELEPLIVVLVRTTARMDAFVLGFAVAAGLALVRRHGWDRLVDPRWLRGYGAAAAVLLVPLLWWTAASRSGAGDRAFLRWGGTLLQLDLAVLVAVLGAGYLSFALGRVLLHPVLVSLGQRSLVLYVWHLPVFVFFERHGASWAWPVRTAAALAITAVLCVLCDRLVERRVTRVLAAPWWRRLDGGVAAYVRVRLRYRAGTDRPR